jgi:hypothetical protein
VIEKTDLQFEKHFDPTISTFLGIKIDWSDEDENVSHPIRVNREFDSNTIELSASDCFLKSSRIVVKEQFRKRIEFGIQTHRISALYSAQSVTVLIEPSSTTTRRS